MAGLVIIVFLRQRACRVALFFLAAPRNSMRMALPTAPTQTPVRQSYDPFARGGRGGMVSIIPSPKDAAEARKGVVSFFVKNLKP